MKRKQQGFGAFVALIFMIGVGIGLYILINMSIFSYRAIAQHYRYVNKCSVCVKYDYDATIKAAKEEHDKSLREMKDIK